VSDVSDFLGALAKRWVSGAFVLVWTRHVHWGYPRVCGADGGWDLDEEDGYGLSPRVRGRRASAEAAEAAAGSIPACAGPTGPLTAPSHAAPVYPRVCGADTC
jgi:hypothetical protein